MKIAVIGASGFLGRKLFKIFSKKYKVTGTYSKNKEEELIFLDARKKEDVDSFFQEHKPELVVDTVALTSSVACEKNPELCEELNYATAKNIAEACNENNATMVFMSSAYLFEGDKGNYNEEDETKPINQYARTKIMAEEEIRKISKYLILRVDVMYGYNGKGKPNGVFNWLLSGNEIALREPNQLRQPVFVDDIPDVIEKLVEKNEKGTFHVAGPTRVNMMDFLKKLEKIVRSDSRVKTSDEKPEIEIKIPGNATFDISKLQSRGIKTHSLEEGLEILKKQFQESN